MNESNFQFKNFLKVAPTFFRNSDKVVFTDKQIRQFDFVSQQVMQSFLTMDEAILVLRGGDAVFDFIPFVTFLVFMHWMKSRNASAVEVAFVQQDPGPFI